MTADERRPPTPPELELAMARVISRIRATDPSAFPNAVPTPAAHSSFDEAELGPEAPHYADAIELTPLAPRGHGRPQRDWRTTVLGTVGLAAAVVAIVVAFAAVHPLQRRTAQLPGSAAARAALVERLSQFCQGITRQDQIGNTLNDAATLRATPAELNSLKTALLAPVDLTGATPATNVIIASALGKLRTAASELDGVSSAIAASDVTAAATHVRHIDEDLPVAGAALAGIGAQPCQELHQ